MPDLASWAGASIKAPRLLEDFGARGDGITDDSAAIQAAANAGVPVYVAPRTFRCNNVTLPDNCSLFSFIPAFFGSGAAATGGAVFQKNANAPVFVCNGHNVRIFGCSIDGNGATFTDVGISMVAASDFRWMWGDITHTAGYCVEWPNSDTGTREIFAYGTFYNQGLTLPAFRLPPADTLATDKQIIGIFCQGGDLADLRGCQTVLISHCDTRNIIFGAGCKKATIVGTRMATVGADTTVFGTNHTIVGNTHAGRFVIDSTCVNSVVGPNTTVAQSVNNSSTCSLITSFNGNTLPEYSKSHGYPGYLTPDQNLAPRGGANLVAVANTAYLNRLQVSEPITINSIAFAVSTAATVNDNIDVGIYDAAGNRLTANGSTAGLVNAVATKNVALTTPVTLLPGRTYWIALAYGPVGGVAATIQGVSVNSSLNAVLLGTGASGAYPFMQLAATFPLPAGPLALAAPAGNSQPLLAARNA